MKKTLLFLGLVASFYANAQDCSELFISEYLEGSSNNKALEIYNPTNQAVDLSGYFVVRYDNGSTTPTVLNAVQLRGTVAAHDVQVAVLDKRDPNGQGQESPIWSDLQAKADEYYCPDYNVSKAFYWNGNDAVVLFKGVIPAGTPLAQPISGLQNVKPIDIFGKIGENPGEANQGGGWTYDGATVANGGVVVSANHFLVRKPSIKKGVTTVPSAFIPKNEWDSLAFLVYVIDQNGDTVLNNQGQPAKKMNVDNLGVHDCECNTLSTEKITKETAFEFNVYPNPATNQELNILTTADLKEVTITNSLGQVIKHITNATSMLTIPLNVGNGVYFVTAKTAQGNTSTKKFIVK